MLHKFSREWLKMNSELNDLLTFFFFFFTFPPSSFYPGPANPWWAADSAIRKPGHIQSRCDSGASSTQIPPTNRAAYLFASILEGESTRCRRGRHYQPPPPLQCYWYSPVLIYFKENIVWNWYLCFGERQIVLNASLFQPQPDLR